MWLGKQNHAVPAGEAGLSVHQYGAPASVLEVQNTNKMSVSTPKGPVAVIAQTAREGMFRVRKGMICSRVNTV